MAVAGHGSRLAVPLATAMLLAKGLAVVAVPAPYRWWALPWDDLAVAGGLAWLLSWLPRVAQGSVVGLALAHCALSLLLVRALGMPLLPSMLRGVDPAMQDSLTPYLTLANLACLATVFGGAAIAHRAARRVAVGRDRLFAAAALAGVLAVLLPAPAHAAHRNALVAWWRGMLPRAVAVPAASVEPSRLAGTDPGLVAAPANDGVLDVARPGCASGRSLVVVVLESAASRFVSPREGPTAMPFLRSLAAQGLDCLGCQAVYPESIEGQVALFCGVPPMPDAEPGDYAAHARAALPHQLARRGYRSALFHAGRFRFLGMREVLAPMGFDQLADAATIGGDRESSFGIDEEAAVDALLQWVKQQAPEQRVCACYLPIAGHHPYASPPGGPFPRDTQIGCYRNALHYADRALRRLWEGLCRLRAPEHWLLCVVGDHGQAFGEHPGNFGHSFQLYEENLRVPLVLVAPGAIGAGGVQAAPCSHLQVVPTLLDLLGGNASVPDGSLLRSRQGPREVCAFTDWGELLVSARVGRWKLIHDVTAQHEALFDLDADPLELHDCATTEPEVATALREHALRFLAAAKHPETR